MVTGWPEISPNLSLEVKPIDRLSLSCCIFSSSVIFITVHLTKLWCSWRGRINYLVIEIVCLAQLTYFGWNRFCWRHGQEGMELWVLRGHGQASLELWILRGYGQARLELGLFRSPWKEEQPG